MLRRKQNKAKLSYQQPKVLVDLDLLDIYDYLHDNKIFFKVMFKPADEPNKVFFYTLKDELLAIYDYNSRNMEFLKDPYGD